MAQFNLDEECATKILGDQPAAFDVYVFKDFLQDGLFKNIETVVKTVKTSPKNNDLYKFEQSKDLLTQMNPVKLPSVLLLFSKILRNNVRPHLEKLTGLKLSDRKFDITVSRYRHGDYLLCHNDDMKYTSKRRARALAFVYYLSSCDSITNGGALTLYRPDDNGEPVEVSHRLNPTANSLVVFKTTPVSWHCVQEVFKHDRISINGWFHLEKPPVKDLDEPQVELCPYNIVKPQPVGDRIEKFFREFVNQEYLMNKTCYLVRRKFKKSSEINLPNFLVKEKYEEICDALKKTVEDEAHLQMIGPFNKRNYKRIRIGCLPQICRDLFEAFKSEFFFLMLCKFTGLDLQPPSLSNETDQMPGDSSDEDPDDDDDDDDGNDADDEEAEGDEEAEDEELPNSDEEDEVEEEEAEDVEQPAETNCVQNGVDASDESRASVDSSRGNKRGHEADSTLGESTTSSDRTSVKRRRIADPLARLEFRHLEPGAYTLLHDYAYETHEKSALDVILHFNHDFDVVFENGGYISYIDVSDDDSVKIEDRELLTVEPKSNSLSLVYREPGTGRFIKYITKSHLKSYQDLSCVFYEKPDDLPGGKL